MTGMVWLALSKCGYPFGVINCPVVCFITMCNCRNKENASSSGWASVLCFPVFLFTAVLYGVFGLLLDLIWIIAFVFTCGWKCQAQCGGGDCVVGKLPVNDACQMTICNFEYATTEKSEGASWTKPAACCLPFCMQVQYIHQQYDSGFDMKRAAYFRDDPDFDLWGTAPVPDLQEIRRQQEAEEKRKREEAEREAIDEQIRRQQDQKYTSPAQHFPTWQPPEVMYEQQPSVYGPPPPPVELQARQPPSYPPYDGYDK